MKVRDVMTKNPITISPDDTVVDALGIIDKFHVWSIPVVHKEKIVGIVTKQDIHSKSKGHEQKVSDIMSKNPVTISPNEELAVAADIIKRTRINAIIVAEGAKIVGVVTRYDIYKKSLQKIDACHYCHPRGDREKKELFQCKYCKEWFCKIHTEPRKPMPAPFKSNNIEEQIEWQKIGGHPCVSYQDVVIDKERISEERLAQMAHQPYGQHPKSTTEPTPLITPKPPTETILPPATPEPRVDGVRECSYCFQKSNELTKCKHCEEFFCKDHIEPKTAHNFLRSKGGHSCTPYAKQLEKVKEKEEPQPELKKADEPPLHKHPNKFIRWFFWKKHPHSRLRKQAFAIHLASIIGLSLLFWMIYVNSDALNGAVIWIFKLGAIIQLILLIFIIRSIYKILVNLKYGIKGLANGYKLITAIVFVLLCFQLYLHPGAVVDPIAGFRYDAINPFEINWNYNNSGSTYDNGNNNQPILPDNNKPTLEQLTTGPKNITLSYIYNAEHGQIDYIVYKGLNDYLASLPREISYYTVPPTTRDFIIRDINQEEQKEFLELLVQKIQGITPDKDSEAKIAISIVQNIPYDWSGFTSGSLTNKFPYEVLYTQSGVCGEKSELLVFLLRELGYGVVTFEYTNHRAVGVKCPIQYSYDGTGYCFVESTVPTIITYSEGDYVGVGKLTSYTMITIFDGRSLDNISEEYNDANEFNRINELSKNSGGVLDEYDYNKWLELVNKYGLQTSNN